MGSWIGVPASKLAEIKQNSASESECKQKLWELYLTEHPSPSWRQVARELYRMGYIEELEVVQKKYLGE